MVKTKFPLTQTSHIQTNTLKKKNLIFRGFSLIGG
jgi:hypothetical protein